MRRLSVGFDRIHQMEVQSLLGMLRAHTRAYTTLPFVRVPFQFDFKGLNGGQAGSGEWFEPEGEQREVAGSAVSRG